VPIRTCLVLVPASVGKGTFAYHTTAESSFGAAWEALQDHEAFHKTTVPDDAILHVVVDGKSSSLHDYKEHNAAQPNFRHRAERVREWGESKTN
jgi:hypothetical protein